MQYSLIEGLAATGAYSLIVIINESISGQLTNYFKGLEDRERRHQFYRASFFLVLGVAYLACLVGNVILKSDLLRAEEHGSLFYFFALLSLVSVIAFPHFKLIRIMSKPTRSGLRFKISPMEYVGIISFFWFLLIVGFMHTLYLGFLVGWLLIQPFIRPIDTTKLAKKKYEKMGVLIGPKGL